MKCTNCGNNLNIDDERCPFCGTENKVAKKHRDDMLKYSVDYDNTRNKVISKSRSVNQKAIKITAVAITLAAVVVLVVLMINKNRLANNHYHDSSKGSIEDEKEQIEVLLEKEDYLALDRLIKAKKLTSVDYWEDSYYDVFSLTSEYSSVFSSIMDAFDGNYKEIHKKAEAVERSVMNFEDRLYYMSEIPAGCEQYVQHMSEDIKLLLKTYFNISESRYEEIFYSSALEESERVGMIEEAIDEYYKTK